MARKGFTITELIITIAVMTMLLGYAWQIYFSGRETMRHNVSQSQMQTENRIFFDHLGREIAQAYRFIDLNANVGTKKVFSFYSFQLTRTGIDRILNDEATGNALAPRDQKFDVLKIEYEWHLHDKSVERRQTPGFLYFLRKPMEFVEGPPAQYEGTPNVKYKKDVLRNVHEIELKAFEIKYKKNFAEGEEPFDLREITGAEPGNASMATFLAMRVHCKIDEVKTRRDEELDLVAKFYSRVRLNDAAYSGYFSTVDENEYY
jgi:prepilin-type N-terminal cleavage/methylation domain-containing protein